MTFYYYWPEKKIKITFKAKNRDSAIRRLKRVTKKGHFEIDMNLKSDLQMLFMQ